MARGINKWIGIGNCCAEPETKYTAGGKAVTNITVACNDEYKDKNTGQMVDKTEFVRVVFFDRLAEIAGEYLIKGSKVYIEGKIVTQKWQDQQGNDRYSTSIHASQMQMLDGVSKNGVPQTESHGGYTPKESQPLSQDSSFDDDIPFS